MADEASRRDRYRAVGTALTGLCVLGVVSATGAATGLATAATAARQAARGRALTTSAGTGVTDTHRSAVLWLRRPHRVVVHTRTVREASDPAAMVLGGSPPSTRPAASTPGAAGHPAGTGATPPRGPQPAPGPVPDPSPPPPPAPTPHASPTSGS